MHVWKREGLDDSTYKCLKVTNPPIIDGRLDDDAWKNAPVIALVRSETGESAMKSTKARMCWDDNNLYVAFDCIDTDIYGTMFNRDDPIYQEDVVEVFLDPNGDLKNYYEFEVSPRNVIFDATIVPLKDEDGKIQADVAWNCEGLKTAVVVDGTLDDRTDVDKGWTVEMAIPFASLGRKTPRFGEKWRGNLYRIDRTPEPVEHQAWSPTMVNPASFHVPSRFGTIEFVEN